MIKSDYRYYLSALGLNMVWDAYPYVMALRDGLRILPGGNISTAAFWSVGLILMIPANIFQKISFPNKILAFIWLSFVALVFIYLNYYAAHYYRYTFTDIRETFTFVVPLMFLFACLYYPNEQISKLIPVTFFYTLFSSILFLYIFFTNPGSIGERAALKFANGGSGNPHTFAANALKLVLSGLLLSGMTQSFFKKIILYFVTFIGIGIIIMSRSSSTIYCSVLSALIFIFFGLLKTSNLFSVSKIKVLGGFIAVLLLVKIILERSPKLSLMYYLYTDQISRRFYNMIYTISGLESGSRTTISVRDASSQGRLSSINYVKSMFEEKRWGDIIVGEGYRANVLDFPVLEALANHGILGFILFNLFAIFMAVYTIREYINPSNSFTILLSYYGLTVLLGFVSGGWIPEAASWIVLVPFIRFLGIPHSPKTSSMAIN